MHWTDNSISRIIKSMDELKQTRFAKCNEITSAAKSRNITLINQVEPMATTAVISAVDSGFATKQFVSLDVVILRSVSAVFTYVENKLAAANYFPSRVPALSVHYGVFSDQNESTCFKSLSRLTSELSCAIQTIKMQSPQMMLLDGSILPLPSDQPASESQLTPMYQELLSLYDELYEICESQNCTLVGVAKDSRSQKLCKVLEQNLNVKIPMTSDEFLCDMLLPTGTRSISFQHSENQEKPIQCFYIKTGKNLPFRVEFISKDSEKDANLIASQLLQLSSSFSYPAILIEADMRAALTPAEINYVFSTIENRAREFVLRSNSRPFR